MSNPTVRLIARAILAGVLAGAGVLAASASWDRAIVTSAVSAAVLAAAEALTPLNQTVGVGKTTPA